MSNKPIVEKYIYKYFWRPILILRTAPDNEAIRLNWENLAYRARVVKREKMNVFEKCEFALIESKNS